MLMVAFLYSITGPYGKVAIKLAGPTMTMATVLTLIGLATAGLALVNIGHSALVREVRSRGKWMLLVGLMFTAGTFAEYIALIDAPVPYYLSIKRLSILVGIFYGWRFFGEKVELSRWVGGTLMLTGHVVILIWA